MARYHKRVVNRISRRNVVGTIGMALGASLLSGTGTTREKQNVTQSARDKFHITAHRGFRDVFPQNTIAAVEGASRLGTDRIEIDVEATSDGEIIVFHDAALDNLTNKEGLVGETPSEIVLQAEVLESGETIPTLAETLDATRPSVMMNIEFKDPGPLSWEEFAERTLPIASRYPGEYYVSSFDPDALRAVQDVDPNVDVAPIFGSNKDENLEIARELDAKAVNPSTGVLDRDLVKTAHEEGREVNVWTVDSWREAQEPLELHVDGLIADYPHMATFATKTTHPKSLSQKNK
ncbi:glycerophosphodiester phosphodiesterase [Haladaptatus sp. DFWS20]|uniref:glycerophosphodiester phosphodiesterase n=1 Tax=Haladaptatus sp. DFWS20 TaxID=3403467 RepID=UPI003EB8535F